LVELFLYITFSGLVNKLASFAISASKHGGQLLNEFFIYSDDITPIPGYLKRWRIFKMTAVALGARSNFKNSHSRNLSIVNAVVTLIARRSDRL